MAVLFCDSFDYGDALHLGGRFSPFFPCCKYTSYSSVTSNSIQAALGGTGNSFEFLNSGFRQQTFTNMKFAGASRPAWCIGFAYRKNGSGGAAPGIHIARFEAGGATLVNPGFFNDGTNATTALMLELMPDDSLSVFTGAGGTPNFPGTLLWNSLGTFSVGNAVIYLELSVNTSTGAWSLYADDVLLQSGISGLIPPGIDRYSLTSFTFETHAIDHHYVTDGERLGPCRVVGFAPNFGSTHQWSPLSGTNLSQVQEFGNRAGLNTPDDNTSYVEASAAGLRDFYGFAAPACFGRILALALNADGEATVSSPSVNFLINQNGVITTVDFGSAFIGGYGIRQAVSLLNPVSGTFWTDADIASALFGFESAGPGTARVTQFMLEKLVSLRNVKYDCGQGSYSYTS